MKKDRGAITIITLTTILFMLAFLIGAYTIVMNRRQVQAEIKKKTKDIYQDDVKNAEEIYQGYFAGDEETVPVWTESNLLKVCKIIQENSNGYIFSKGKIYKCTASSNYKLETDLNLNDLEYADKYPELFEEKKWIESEIITTTQTLENQVTNFETVGSSTYEAPATGTYTLQVWGAQGGYRSSSTYGGKGGYSIGTVNLNQGEKLYVYVGGSGNSVSSASGSIYPGGYNGGGYRYQYKGGGGATDIRLTGGNWNDIASLKSRIIVAGGGGSDGSTNKTGMYGGGTAGGSSTENYTANGDYCGKGGTQTYSGYSTNYTITSQATSGLTSNSLANYGGGFGFGGGGVYLNSGYGGAGGGRLVWRLRFSTR